MLQEFRFSTPRSANYIPMFSFVVWQPYRVGTIEDVSKFLIFPLHHFKVPFQVLGVAIDESVPGVYVIDSE